MNQSYFMEINAIELAKKYCEHFHAGQFRKGNKSPYSTHPLTVSDILKKYGYSDPITQAIAILHDIVEDTEVITGEIKDRFGYEIANGVFVLSKNTISKECQEYSLDAIKIGKELSANEIYRLRLAFARRSVKRVKIADMIHNTSDLESLSNEGRRKKIVEAERFYIPMGKKVCPIMVKELEKNINNFKKKFKQ